MQLNKTVVYNYNGANSGATVNGTLSQNNMNDLGTELVRTILDLDTIGKPAFRQKTSLSSFWFGTNDIDIGVQKKFDRDSYLEKVMSSYRKDIEQMCLGHITHILLMNAPNVTRTPSVAKLYRNNYTRLHDHALMNLEFNKKFKAMYEDLKKNCTNAKVYHYDTFSFFDKVLDDPNKYGFKNATCVDDAEEQKGFDLEAYKKGLTCPWRNDLHPGRKFNYWLAKDLAENVFPELGLWK
ncbi:hypothetical protein KEM56_007018 [Ascosphaera pollenicola]|nr:hypothetical protein KEM56_007018 [Ascosphaera pollenicola]